MAASNDNETNQPDELRILLDKLQQEHRDLDAGERLFVRLALCSLLQRLAVFHEARGHRPIAASRLDRAALASAFASVAKKRARAAL